MRPLCNRELVDTSNIRPQNGRPFPLRDYRFCLIAAVYFECIRRRFYSDINDAAINALQRSAPKLSAAKVLSLPQFFIVFFALVSFGVAFVKWPIPSLIFLNSLVTFYFIFAIFFRFYLMLVGAKRIPQTELPGNENDQNLPIITILLPLYNDAESLPSLTAAIEALDYPDEKKDVKLLLEEDDHKTQLEAERLGLNKHYDVLLIPDGGPKNKTKGLQFWHAFSARRIYRNLRCRRSTGKGSAAQSCSGLA